MKLSNPAKVMLSFIGIVLIVNNHLYAVKTKEKHNLNSQINTAYDDSLSRLNISAGDIFVVDAKEFIVYTSKNEIETMNFLDWKTDTLKEGEKFKVLEILRLKTKLGALIALPDSSRAYVVNLVTLPKYCYKEGTNPTKGRIERWLDSMLRFTYKEFWIILGITLLTSLLYLIFAGAIDKKLYKWSGFTPKVSKPGTAFLLASAFFGALTGLTILFYDTEFKNFILHVPVLAYPSRAGIIVKFFWIQQLVMPAFFGWAIFRSIREFGPKTGLVRSFILLIPAIAIYWTTLATSFIALAGLLIVTFMSAMASDVGKGPQASSVIKEEYQTGTGEKKTVRINYDAQGRTKSKKYI
jgi:hypothetical protein